MLPTPNEETKVLVYPENCVCMAYRGSIAHNMYIPNTDPNSVDDIDLMGVFMGPRSHYIGLKQIKETQEKLVGQWDVVNYEYIKMVRLLLKANPNVLSLLWLDSSYFLHQSDYFTDLIINRELFNSKIAYNSFTGYAYGQLKKMTSHTKQGYMGQKRLNLVKQYGYDTKNAAHCIRLLRMGIEYLKTEKLNVYREDAKELLDIKKGGWPLYAVTDEASRLFEEAKVALKGTSLPEKPDFKNINALVMDSISHYLR